MKNPIVARKHEIQRRLAKEAGYSVRVYSEMARKCYAEYEKAKLERKQ